MLRRVAIPSPIQREQLAKKPPAQLTLTDLVQAIAYINSLGKTLEGTIANAQREIDSFRSIQKGDKGDPADPVAVANILLPHIPTPKDGKDADHEAIVRDVLAKIPTPQDGKSPSVEEVIPAILTRIREPKYGEDAVVDHDQLAQSVIERILEGKMIKTEHIDGFLETMNSFKREIGQRTGYVHGGGDTLKAGAGQTLTRNSDGTTTLSVAGTTPPVTSDLSSQCDGSNKIFTIPANSSILSLLGTDAPIVYKPGTDYTIVGTTLTIAASVNAPSNGATLILTYVP